MNQFALEEQESRYQMRGLGLTDEIISGIIQGGAAALGVGGAVATQVLAAKTAAAQASAARKLQAAQIAESAKNRALTAQITQAQLDFEAQKATATDTLVSKAIKGAIIVGIVGAVGLIIYGGIKYRRSSQAAKAKKA